MRLITRYLVKEILYYFAIFLALIVAVLLIAEIFDSRKQFVEHSPSFAVVVQFLVYSIPKALSDVLPLTGLMATIFAYGMLARHREILAMVAAGVSFARLAVPAVLFGAALTVGAFLFNERVVPTAQTRATFLEKVVIERRSEAIFTRRNDLFVKGDGRRFYLMKEYLSDRNEMIRPTILEVREDGAGLTWRIEAEVGRLRDGEWEFLGARRWEFADDGFTVRLYEQYDVPYRMQMEEKLARFLSKSKRPEEMNFAELREYCDLIAAKGGEPVERYLTDLHRKIAFPFGCLLMALLGFGVIADVHARHLARGMILAFALAFGYYLLDNLLRKLGVEGALAPLAAAWTGQALLAAVVAVLIKRLETIRA